MWTRMEERQGDINRVEGGGSSLRKSARSQWRKMRDEWAGGLKGAASHTVLVIMDTSNQALDHSIPCVRLAGSQSLNVMSLISVSWGPPIDSLG